MSVGKTSLGSPYRWLGEAFVLCRAHPRAILGAACLLMLVALLPSLLQVLLETALKPSAAVALAMQALFSVVSLIVFPPLVGGFYRLAHDLHAGKPGNALDLLAVFQDAAATRRLIMANLIFVLLMIVLLVGTAYAFGGEALFKYLSEWAAIKPGATVLPAFPDGLLPLMAGLMILAMVIMTAQGLATAQVAIAGSAPLSAVAAGFGVAVRNIGTFLLFYLPLALIGFVAMLVVVLVAVLIGAMLSVLSPMLAALLLAPLSLLLATLLYALMFTFFYHAWRDTLGPIDETEQEHQLIA